MAKKLYQKISDGSSFPVIPEELEWRLRHAPEAVTRGDELTAASIIDSYRYLVYESTQKKRDRVARDMRAAAQPEGGSQ